MKTLTTVKEVIAELGGRAAVAEITGTNVKVVSHWRWQDRFPSKTYLVLTEALNKRGCCASVGLWSFTQTEDMRSAEAV
jgi:hypothetical protein